MCILIFFQGVAVPLIEKSIHAADNPIPVCFNKPLHPDSRGLGKGKTIGD